ncbi:hypothetical protein [Microbacterium paraoxydans]|uniref:Uncharacterized protein n=1 Tax=Microbacterium paraoxydans TaxID=199592 RepID=A0ABS5IMG3_9MICO|nr:hypothetical protein [Microbacterium paraoxydans]MBS0024118.1 hypothetical protein [Microbacterium paraoxydans]
MTDLETARTRAETARTNVETVKKEVGEDFREHLAAALEQMLERTIVEQHDITTAMNPAELVTLKINITQAATTAIDQVDAQLDLLDIEELAKKARPNMTGESFVDYREVLSPLLRITGELLQKAGYSMEGLESARFGRGYDIANLNAGYAAPTAARRLDAAIEGYGKAAAALAEADTAAKQARAREAWDNAD